jgi:hypothetical protein
MEGGPKTPPLTALIGSNTPKKPSKSDASAPTSIWLKVDLKKTPVENGNDIVNVVVDFLKEAENKYGFQALHPESKTAMDLLNDVDDNEMDDDDNDDIDLEENDEEAAPGESASQNAGEATPVQSSSENKPGEPKKRKPRTEARYDLNDPFIDDSELQWEEQAASTKDGFFVYSGPLVQQGEQLVIEKADGSLKRTKAFSEENGTAKKKPGPKKKVKDPNAPPAKRQKTEKKEKVEKSPKETKTKEQKAVEKAEKKAAADKAKAEKAAEKAPEKPKKNAKANSTVSNGTNTVSSGGSTAVGASGNAEPASAPGLANIAPKPVDAAAAAPPLGATSQLPSVPGSVISQPTSIQQAYTIQSFVPQHVAQAVNQPNMPQVRQSGPAAPLSAILDS